MTPHTVENNDLKIFSRHICNKQVNAENATPVANLR